MNTADPNGSGIETLSLPTAMTLAAANPGADIINFDPAIFPENAPLAIMLSVELEHLEDGDSIDGTGAGVILDGSAFNSSFHEFGLYIRGSGVGVTNLTLRKFPQASIRMVLDASATITNVTIEDSGFNGTPGGKKGMLLTETSSVDLAECTIVGSGRTGIEVGADAQATITNCLIEDSGIYGIRGTGQSLLTISDTVITGSLIDGVSLQSNAHADITDSTLTLSGDNGLECFSDSTVSLTRIIVNDNVGTGLRFQDNCTATLDRISFENNGGGGFARDSTSVTRWITAKTSQTPEVSVADLIPIRNAIGQSWRLLDLNGDGGVGMADMSSLKPSIDSRFRPVLVGNGLFPNIQGNGFLGIFPENHQHILVVPEGYNQGKFDDGTFDADVTEWLDAFLDLEPYASMHRVFSVWKLYEPSQGTIGSGFSAFQLPVTDDFKGVASMPGDGPMSNLVWSAIESSGHPWPALKFYPPGGRSSSRAKNLTIAMLPMDIDKGRAGLSGRAGSLNRFGDNTKRIGIGVGFGLNHEFSHAYAFLADEYIEDSDSPKSDPTPDSYDSENVQNEVFGTTQGDCAKAPWNHLLVGSEFNPASPNVVGYFGVDGFGFHSEYECKMNGSHDNATYFCGDANLRPSQYCNWCRELAVFRIHERVGILNNAEDSYAKWEQFYRDDHYDVFPFITPSVNPPIYQACGETPICSPLTASTSDEVIVSCDAGENTGIPEEISLNGFRFDNGRDSSGDLGTISGILPPTTSIGYALRLPLGQDIRAMEPFMVQVRASYTAPLVATGYELSVTGSASLTMTDRTMHPIGNSLTYLSDKAHDPFNDDLPRDLRANPLYEAAFDADFNDDPGGPSDGLFPGNEVLIETIEVVPSCSGSITLTLSRPSAAQTRTSPDGAPFETISILSEGESIDISVGPGRFASDFNCNGLIDDIDSSGLVSCISGPIGGFLSQECASFSEDGLGVDLLDIANFQRVFQGEASDSATYEMSFTSTWSAQTYPIDFPRIAHWSAPVVVAHNSQYVMWEEGGIATLGIENLAELGNTADLISEANLMITLGRVGEVIQGSGIEISPGSTSLLFTATKQHSQASVISKQTPSPDWFVGVSGMELFVEGNWVDQVTVSLKVYDAGTDSGLTYLSPDGDTDPQEPVYQLIGPPLSVDAPVLPVGAITFMRIN